MKLWMIAMLAAGASAPALAEEVVPVAYDALSAGRNAAAVEQLTHSPLSANDPARLINLGTAYARLGRIGDAAAMYRAAAESEARYDLELANGKTMDSRAAARMALAQLERDTRYAAK